MRRAWERLPQGLRAALFAYLCFRVPLELLASAAAGSLPQGPGATGMPPLDGPQWAQAWLRWDSGWYVRIIREGYSYSACVLDTDPCAQASIAFFPLFPLAVRALFLLGIPLSISAFVVTHLSLICALWGLHRLSGRLLAPDAQLRAVAALLVFPLSIFLSTGYAESLLIALGVWAFVGFEEDRPWLTGVCLALAILTRSHGVLLAGALVVGAAWKRNWRLAAICAGFSALSGGAYLGWLGVTYGDPLAFVHARKAWGYVGPAWTHVTDYARRTWSGETGLEGWSDFAAAPWLLVVGVLSWRRFGPAYGLFVLAIFATAAQAGQVWALARISLCAIPAYLLLAEWSARPRVRTALLAGGLSWVAMGGLRFVNGWFTGS